MQVECKPRHENEYAECAAISCNLSSLMPPAILGMLAGNDLRGKDIAQGLVGSPTFCAVHPKATGIYRVPERMEGDGLVVSTRSAPEDGPAKRDFQLTDDGRSSLRRWTDTLTCYHDAIDELIDVVHVARGTDLREGEVHV